jgi:phosphoglycolate phosphatase
MRGRPVPFPRTGGETDPDTLFVKLILFDVDGTLVHYRGVGRRAAVRAFRDVFGIPDADALLGRVPMAGSTDPRILREMAVACSIPEPVFEARRDPLRRAYLGELRDEIRAFEGDPVLPGVRALLDALAGRADARLGLLTGNFEPGAHLKLEPHGLDRYFPAGGFGDDSEDRRVVAAVARARCAAHHGFDPPPERVIVVGDTVHDVDCARANGFRAIGVCTGYCDRDTLRAAGADDVLADLSGPRAIAGIVG